jgi:hypothetical protein
MLGTADATLLQNLQDLQELLKEKEFLISDLEQRIVWNLFSRFLLSF